MHSEKFDNEYLLTGLRQNDPAVFKLIYHLYWQKLYNIVFYYLQNSADAEDAVQDVFISLWSRRENINIKVALENYLVRSAKYTAFFYLKIKYKNEESLQHSKATEAVNDSEEYIEYKSLLDQVNAIFETVSQKTREVFYLSRFDGLTYPEIAAKLDISVKTVEYHISQALKRLSLEKF
ncbi:MAG: RNA polymerase sigma-70 factor [Chitinophagaceae bacterium]